MAFMMKLVKFFLRGLLRLLYRVEVSGLENYQKAGPRVLIVANHTSLLDGLLLYAWLPEMPTFAINDEIAARPLIKIPIISNRCTLTLLTFLQPLLLLYHNLLNQ